MPRPAKRDQHPDKFARYRATQRAKGMKLLRIWVPDPNAPGFKEEADRQARIINAAPDRDEITAFIEAAAAWPEEPYDWGPDGPPAGATPMSPDEPSKG